MNFRRSFSLALALVVFLAGCQTGTSPYAPNQGTAPPSAAVTTIAPAPATPTRAPGCTVQANQPRANPTVETLIPSVTQKDWTQGPDEAPVTILEYSDFQCPGCAGLETVLAQLQEKYPEEVRVAFRHYPLDNHDKAALAAQSADAAGIQGKFWEMHELLFEQREKWIELSPAKFQEWLLKNAPGLGLDVEQFEADLNSDALVKMASDAYERNAAIGMPGTPFLVINGVPYNGPLDYGNLETTITLILLEERQFSECPAMVIGPRQQYFAVLHTEKGDITLELYADKAPLAVNSFIFLARNDWFDDVTFHRVIEGFVAQAGDPSGTGFGGPGYAFDNEINPGLTFNGPGVLAMANAGAGSNGSQFFITYAAVPRLNGGYTIFGRLVSGMDVLLKLTPRDPSQSMDLPAGDQILDVEIIEK